MKVIVCPIQTINKKANADMNIEHGNMECGLIWNSHDLFKQ
jgi:hypothetical protein